MDRIQNEHDIVTGLPFYDSFISRVKNELGSDFEPNEYVLVSTDISNFKYINRIYGYARANELLKSLIDIVTGDSMNNIVACRTHSDHVISLFRYDGNKSNFTMMVEGYSNEFVRKNSRKFPSVTLHLNNGLYFLNDADEDLLYSIDKANIARRVSKGNYCVTSVLFSDDMMGRKEEDAKILAAFDSALQSDRIKIYMQPKIDITSHTINGAEALSRIYDEDGQLMMPDVFIPVLENSGKVVDLDRYVMHKVFIAIREWIDKGCRLVPISINLSRMHFYTKDVADTIYTDFLRYNIPIEYIEFELTESLFFAEADLIINEISKLRAYGFKVSMDDFGVGYSTLNSLGLLPVDVIKFDKGFVKSSISNDTSYQIFQSLIKVFRKINYNVICEGIETRDDEKMVFECGCDNAQGFLYDRPLEIGLFEDKYLKKN